MISDIWGRAGTVVAVVGLVTAAAPAAFAQLATESANGQHLPEAVQTCEPSEGFTDCARFTYDGADQTFTVPETVNSVKAHVWGAGGGGVPADYTPEQLTAGGGGYAMGAIPVTAGQTLTVVVGQGGQVNSLQPTYGGGGAGGGGAADQQNGASGGGMSGVFLADAAHANAKIIAGGGGSGAPGTPTTAGGKDDDNFGGGGGDAQFGGDAAFNSSWNGGGGHLDEGGFAAEDMNCSPVQTAGAELQGGDGGTSATFEGGGGGGGGYWGGGGGRCQNADEDDASGIQNGGGGGGSGFLADDVTDGTSERGKNPSVNGEGGAAGGTSDPFYTAGVGTGGNLKAAEVANVALAAGGDRTEAIEDTGNGGDGEVVLLWKTGPVPPLPVTGDSTASTAIAGIAAVAAGAVLMMAIRPRRRTGQ